MEMEPKFVDAVPRTKDEAIWTLLQCKRNECQRKFITKASITNNTMLLISEILNPQPIVSFKIAFNLYMN